MTQTRPDALQRIARPGRPKGRAGGGSGFLNMFSSFLNIVPAKTGGVTCP